MIVTAPLSSRRSSCESRRSRPEAIRAATVSVGVACGSAFAEIDTLIARADAALYRAKTNGRDRVEASDEAVPGAPERRGQGAAQNPQGAILRPVPTLAVPLVGSFRAAQQNAVCRS